MCKISTTLLDGYRYRGTIVRLGNRGHRFDPFGVIPIRNGRNLVPVESVANDNARFEAFRSRLQWAIYCSLDPEPSWFIEDFSGNKHEIRARVLELNRLAGLPGIVEQYALTA